MAPLEGLCRRLGVHHATLAVVLIQFGSGLVNSIFSFYYVKVFLNVYKISEGWFQTAQVLFMVWNAVNDPIFGLFQDLGKGWIRSRRRIILYSGPFYGLFFLLFWFPWSDKPSIIGIQLIVSLFLYDGIFSFALLAWCALFAEITTDHASRVRAMKYNQIMFMLGVNSITVAEKMSQSLQNFAAFQTVCFGFAIVCIICCSYTGLYSSDKAAQDKSKEEALEAALLQTELMSVESLALMGEKEEEEDREAPQSWGAAWRIVRQIVAARDFQRITAANFLHTCRSTLHTNFAAIFTEGLIPRSLLPLGSWQISLFYGLCSLLPQVLVITGSSILNRFGFCRVLQFSFTASVVSGLGAFALIASLPEAILAFMLLDSVLVHTFSPLMTMLFTDFIDDDMMRYRRRTPMSSLVFSMNALFTKPAQSLAPMLAVYILNQSHYEAYNDKNIEPDQLLRLQKSMFTLLCLCPAVLGVLQWGVIRRYSLHSRHRQDPADLLALAVAAV